MQIDALLINISIALFNDNNSAKEAPCGLLYIAEYCYQNGHDVKVKQFTTQDPIISEICHLLKKYNCNIIGFSVNNDNQWDIKRVIIALKQENPDLFCIIGGPQVTGDYKLALKRIPLTDIAVIGEGELSFCEILSEIKSGKKSGMPYNFSNIKGIVINKSNNTREVIYTGKRPAVKNIDIFNFPKSDILSLDKDINYHSIITGRGCVGHCTFCYESNKKENNLRLRSIENVIEEIDYIVPRLKRNKYFSFNDDTFILSHERVIRLCNHMINKYNGEIKWFCEARVDILKDNLDLLPIMKKAGLIRVQLGGESGNQKVLDAYKKNMSPAQLRLVVKAIYENGIDSIYVNFIIGGAHETLETVNDTIELAKSLLHDAPLCVSVGCSMLTPYVGTPILERPFAYGITIVDKESVRGYSDIPCVHTKELTEQKILQLFALFHEEIMNTKYKLIKKASKQAIYNIYSNYYTYGLSSEWHDICQTIKPIKNYHEAIFEYGYARLSDFSLEELQYAIPVRTINFFSNGEEYLLETFINEFQCYRGIKETLLMLSSGKLCFIEICQIIVNKENYCQIDNFEDEIIKSFEEFDNQYLIVWRKCV